MNLVNKVNNLEGDRVRGVIEDLVTIFEQTVSTDDERRLFFRFGLHVPGSQKNSISSHGYTSRQLSGAQVRRPVSRCSTK